ncbi:MAG: hypothetical protein WDZ91_06795 [Paenibacillaceae bacterium]
MNIENEKNEEKKEAITHGGSRPNAGRKPIDTIRRVITYSLTEEQWRVLELAAGGKKKVHSWFNKMRAEEADKLLRLELDMSKKKKDQE